MTNEAKNEGDILRVISYGTAIGFGFMLASLEALRRGSTGFTFQVSFWTLLAFALGPVIVLPFWKIIFSRSSGPRQKFLRGWAEMMLALLGVGAFLYPLRFVPKNKLPDIFIGLSTAVLALSILGSILWTFKRFLDADERQNGSSKVHTAFQPCEEQACLTPTPAPDPRRG